MREPGQPRRTPLAGFCWLDGSVAALRVHARPRRACTSVKGRKRAGPPRRVYKPMCDWCNTNYREEWICVDGPAKECHRLTPGKSVSRSPRPIQRPRSARFHAPRAILSPESFYSDNLEFFYTILLSFHSSDTWILKYSRIGPLVLSLFE